MSRFRIISGIAAFFLLFAGVLLLPAEAEAVGEARQSVVHLYGIGYDETGRMESRWTGTGFAVGIAGEPSDIFLTNWHVVTGSGKYGPGTGKLWLLREDARFYPNKEPMPETSIECEVLSTTSGNPDVAVIRTLEPSDCRALPLLSSRRVTNGTRVYALGFPGFAATHSGADSGPEDVVITEGRITDHLKMSRAGFTSTLIHTAALQRGNSGGPLVNAQGAVVAQNTYGFAESVCADQFCAVYIDYGMELLDGLGIAYTTAPGPSRITVLVANTLHLPEIGDAAAMGVFISALLLALLFVLYFLKTLREAVMEWKEQRRRKRDM